MTEPLTTVVVDVQSPWWSKVNWAQIVGFVCSLLTLIIGHGFAVLPEVQAAIILFLQAVTGLATVILRTYFSKTITPQSITPAIVLHTQLQMRR